MSTSLPSWRRLAAAGNWLVDLALFGLAVVVGFGFLATDWHHISDGLFSVDAVLTVAACSSLWGRRRHPLAVGWIALALGFFSDGCAGAGLVALFTVAARCAPRRTLELWLAALAAGVSATLIYREGHSVIDPLAFWVVATVAVVGTGSYLRARRELLASLRERAQRAEGEQELRVREAQLAERSRIAREMHDVLAHRISLLSVHAGALEFNPDASGQDIARAAGVIRSSARAAQEELRDVIGVLRAGNGTDGLAPPQPTIGDLAGLVQESLGAGMDVSLTSALDGVDLSPVIGRTVYRVVQEALTNARKHAPGQAVAIDVDGGSMSGLRVEIVNRPRVGEAGGAALHSNHVGSGTGLVGLTERVTLAGGRLNSEALPDGGFKLVATLPWAGPASGERTDR